VLLMPRRELPEPLAEKVGSRLRALRLERGMSVSEVARLSGLSKGHLANMEHGFTQATVGTLVAAARALGVAPSMLLVFPGEEPLGSVLEHVRVHEDEGLEERLLKAVPVKRGKKEEKED